MFFNDGMSIWILAFLILAAGALAGWRQGAIRAAILFVGILLATWLAAPLGGLLKPLLARAAGDPIIAWLLAPIAGFVLVSLAFTVAAQLVHKKVELFYKYSAGDLRRALWERVNSRLGICLGLLNGAAYFVLAVFLVFNVSYWTVQAAGGANQPAFIRLANRLGGDLQASGLARVAKAVGTLPPMYYRLADLTGFLVQNPEAAQRLADYPALTSLWERDDFQSLVTDSALTNALASGTSLKDLAANPNVKSFLANKDQTKLVMGILQTNLDDLTEYLTTGKSAKYDAQKIIGHREFNPAVTLAWLRQNNPKIPASEMRAVRMRWSLAYSNTVVLATGDNQFFLKNLPRFAKQTQPGQPFFQPENWKGDWSATETNYEVHVALNGEDKFMEATAEALRLTLKDGRTLLIFDRAD